MSSSDFDSLWDTGRFGFSFSATYGRIYSDRHPERRETESEINDYVTGMSASQLGCIVLCFGTTTTADPTKLSMEYGFGLGFSGLGQGLGITKEETPKWLSGGLSASLSDTVRIDSAPLGDANAATPTSPVEDPLPSEAEIQQRQLESGAEHIKFGEDEGSIMRNLSTTGVFVIGAEGADPYSPPPE